MPSHKEICDACTLGGSFPVRGEGLSRRRLFRVAGTAIVGSYFADVLNPPRLEAAVGTGAPGHGHELHLRLHGRRTEPLRHVGPQGRRLDSRGIRPDELSATSGSRRASCRRSPRSSTSSSSCAPSSPGRPCTVSRRPGRRSRGIRPAFSATSRRTSARSSRSSPRRSASPGDILPGFVGLGTSSMIGSGYMSSRYAPLVVPSVSTAGLRA